MKNKIFLGHASTQDNYFAGWLAQKLKLLGYDVWCDIEDLRGGDDFWAMIEGVLRNETIVFIPIYTEKYVKRAAEANSGVRKEIRLVDTLMKSVPGFRVIPVIFENTNYVEINIHFHGLQSYDFSKDGWADGLKKLVKDLEKFEVKTKPIEDYSGYLSFWFKTLDVKNNLLAQREKYFTNWFPLDLPTSIYIHEIIPEYFGNSKIPFPHFRDKNFVLSFTEEEILSQYCTVAESHEIDLPYFLSEKEYKLNDTVTFYETNRKVIRLLNESFTQFLLESGCEKKSFANEDVFYFKSENRVSLKQIGKTNVQLSGKAKGYKWHFGINGEAFLFPFPAIAVHYHIVFTSVNGQRLKPKLLHKLRRSIPKDWYNRKWLYTLLGAFQYLGKSNSKIEIPFGKKNSLSIELLPFSEFSDKGYLEPTKTETQENGTE